MALNAVQNDSNNSSGDLRRQSFLKSAASGAVIGYALKWATPILPQEKDDIFVSETTQIEEDAKVAKEEVEAIKNSNPKIKGSDEFVRLYETKKINFTDKSKLESTFSDDLMKLYSRVSSKIKEVKEIGYDNRVTLTKGARPTSIFIALGVGVGIFSALVHNIYVENIKNGISNESLAVI